MTAIFNRDDVPGHLSSVHQLDFSGDLFAERLAGPWVRLSEHLEAASQAMD